MNITDSDNYAVEMQGITKVFGNFTALDNVCLKVEKGSVHSVLGENGAGKSTLMNILYGIYRAEGGTIKINGTTVDIKTPGDAINAGIGMVHQHFMLVEPFTVTQNIMLGRETTGKFGIMDTAKVKKDIVTLSEKYGLAVDPDAKIENISVGMQQRVEILKALYRGVDILILDEPTAVLTPQEIIELFDITKKLAEGGKTVILITHKLKEIKASSSKCTVIRRGKTIDTVPVKDVGENELASIMVGRNVNLHVQKSPSSPGEPVLEITDLTVADERGADMVKNLSLSVRAGEIVGIAGVDGNGQKELVEAITNLVRAKSGSIKVSGKELCGKTPLYTMEAGVATIPEDRHKHGLVLDFTVAENMVLNRVKKAPFSSGGLLNLGEIAKNAAELTERFDVRPANAGPLQARGLSGGNQQKIIIAREVSGNPALLIAVQPTRGLDVGAIEYVHKALIEQRDKGKAVLLISFELDEILDVSDRVAVIYSGSIVSTLDAQEANEKNVGLLMAGGCADHHGEN